MTQPWSFTRQALVTVAATAIIGGAMLAPCTPAGATPVHRAHAHARRHAAAPVTPAAAPVAAAPAAAHGMVVGIDPETGRLGMPTQDQMLQLSPIEKTGLLRTTAGLQTVRLADGTVMLNLQGRFMDYSVVRLDANGRPRVGCVDDVRALGRWLGAGEPVSAPVLEER
jgi:hypothetical protein